MTWFHETIYISVHNLKILLKGLERICNLTLLFLIWVSDILQHRDIILDLFINWYKSLNFAILGNIFNSLWCSHTIWRQRSGSTLADGTKPLSMLRPPEGWSLLVHIHMKWGCREQSVYWGPIWRPCFFCDLSWCYRPITTNKQTTPMYHLWKHNCDSLLRLIF